MQDRQPFILTKIIATVGPATEDPTVIAQLIELGARVFRINFSHGSFERHEQMLKAIRQASEDTGIPAGVLGDLSGPKIRLGQVQEGGIDLHEGMRVEFTRAQITAQAPRDDNGPVVFSSTLESLIDDVEPGHRLLIDDGAVRLLAMERVVAADGDRLICAVTTGGPVSTSKGINLPDTPVSSPSLTEKDWRCVEWALEHDLDFLALSFVRKAEDVRVLKERLIREAEAMQEGHSSIPVIAKIEKPQALDDLKAIVKEADAVMVARGDLGVEMDLARVPVAQKRIIKVAHGYGKPVIVATQMLQSMIELPSPTRAEVSDVANAIFEGADCVMLSGETAVGKHPVQAVKMMNRIARTIQDDRVAHLPPVTAPPSELQLSRYRTAALAHGVNVIVRDLDARLMAIWSERGGGARYLSQNRPTIPIIAASSDPATLRRMSLLFGVVPVGMPPPASLEDFGKKIEQLAFAAGWARRGQWILVVGGEPIGSVGVTNTLAVRRVGGDLGLTEAGEAAGKHTATSKLGIQDSNLD